MVILVLPQFPVISLKAVAAIGINAGNNAYISDNNITGCYYGVYAIGNSTITRNLILSNTLRNYDFSQYCNYENNIIANNNYGISGGGTIRNNTIGNNQIGFNRINC